MTKDKLYYAKRLNDKIEEYNKFKKEAHRTLQIVKKEFGSDSEVYTETGKLIYEHYRTLDKQVAMCAMRCLNHGIFVNEFALACISDFNDTLEVIEYE